MKTERMIQDYLTAAGYLTPPRLGEPPTIKPGRAAADKLHKQLEKERRRIVHVLISLYVATFVVGVAAMLIQRESSGWFQVCIGGSLLTITFGFQRFWQEKTIVDILLQQIPNLTPDELVKVLGNVWEFFLKKKK